MGAQGTRGDLLDLSESELLARCAVDTLRGSGPGGQKRNKTESAVRLRHLDSGVSALSDATRSQHQNKALALRALRLRLALELRNPVDPERHEPPEPLRALLAPRGRRPGPRAEGYAAGVAALLDLLVAHGCAIGDTARALGIGTGRLSRLVLSDDEIARRVNALRAERGLRPLRP